MRNLILKIPALICAFAIAAAAAEESAEIVPVLELPEAEGGEMQILLPESDPMLGPREEYYLFREGEKSPYGYADPSITVNIGTGRIYKTNYMYARVRIAEPGQIRTMMCESSLEKETTNMPDKLARRVKAVVAVNGVLEADGTVKGPVIRQGVWLRPDGRITGSKLEHWKKEPSIDTLVIDGRGDLRILEDENWDGVLRTLEDMGSDAVNVIAFGPALIVDGEPRYGYVNRQMSTHRVAQRMAICQTGPLEYLLITSEGPENPGSTGLLLDQFTELIATAFPEVKTAYNLDGGSSSALIFRKGSEFWAKINCPRGGKKRPLRDIIYFADAWLPDEPEPAVEVPEEQEASEAEQNVSGSGQAPADNTAAPEKGTP